MIRIETTTQTELTLNKWNLIALDTFSSSRLSRMDTETVEFRENVSKLCLLIVKGVEFVPGYTREVVGVSHATLARIYTRKLKLTN